MSYSVTYRDGGIEILASAQPAALGALVSLASRREIAGDDAEGLCRALSCATSLETALRAFGWDSCSNESGDIVHAWMIGDELGHSEAMFRALAPHIQPGSHVEFIGEDGDIWRWSFDGRHVIETYPQLVWPPASPARRALTIGVLRSFVSALRSWRRAAL